MADFNYQLSAPWDGGAEINKSVVYTVTNEYIADFFECYRASYGQIKDKDSGEMRDMTDEETFAKWAHGVMMGTDANVRRYVEDKAKQDAVAGLPPPQELPPPWEQ